MSVARLIFALVFIALASLGAYLMLADSAPQGRRGYGRGAVTVVTQAAEVRAFADLVEALGTARARESVMITSRVTDTVSKVYFDDGQIVKTGDLLVELISEEEEAQFREAEGNLMEARRNFDRTEGLVERGNSSGAALDEARRRLDEARSRIAAAKARLDDRQIRAPFDGVLGLRNVSEGSLVTPNGSITTIDAIDVINLDFSVPERFIAVLGKDQPVSATVEAYPDRMFEGRVKTVDSRVDPATRQVVVRAEIPNGELLLRPGMLMTVEVTSRTWSAVSVPEESVVAQAGKDYVFVITGEAAERRPISLGVRIPGFVEVKDGLNEAERVVVEGTQRLGRSGIKVRDLSAPGGAQRGRGAAAPASGGEG